MLRLIVELYYLAIPAFLVSFVAFTAMCLFEEFRQYRKKRKQNSEFKPEKEV